MSTTDTVTLMRVNAKQGIKFGDDSAAQCADFEYDCLLSKLEKVPFEELIERFEAHNEECDRIDPIFVYHTLGVDMVYFEYRGCYIICRALAVQFDAELTVKDAHRRRSPRNDGPPPGGGRALPVAA